MSKFCGNCGAELDNSAAVCGYCGTPLKKKSLLDSIPGISDHTDDAMMQNIQKYGKFVAAGIAALVVLVIIIAAVSNNTGYKGTVDKYFKGIQKVDVETVNSLTADLDMIGYDDDEREEEILDEIEYAIESLEEDYGKNIKFKVDIIAATEWDLDDVKLRRFVEDFEEDEDYDISLIKKAVELELDVTIKGDKKERTETIEDFWMIKEDGKWKVTNYDL